MNLQLKKQRAGLFRKLRGILIPKLSEVLDLPKIIIEENLKYRYCFNSFTELTNYELSYFCEYISLWLFIYGVEID